MRNLVFFFLFLLLACQPTLNKAPTSTTIEIPFDKNKNQTPTYDQTIDWYKAIASQHSQVSLMEYGLTDVGKPLHLAVLSNDGDFDPTSLKEKGKRIVLINNAIHPGEPCGVDASMLLIRDLLTKEELIELLDNVVVAIIPMYNIGGVLNRSSHSRANQNGPIEYGFRGNAKNLDLNRDFIKCDSRNAKAFTEIFQAWQPDVFIDNHTSNGADYQYVMTMIGSQHNKLGGALGKYLKEEMMPLLFEDMEKKGWPMTPYVYARTTPDEGIAGFLDLPRYSTGYAALFNSIGFVPETHMLKPYEQRVESTRAFSLAVVQLLHGAQGEKIAQLRQSTIEASKSQESFAINWELDQEKVDSFLFKGYTAKYKPSEITGLDRLYYDRNEPFEKNIPFFDHYKTSLEIKRPAAYLIPQAWHAVLERLKWNGIEMERLDADRKIEVEVYYIKDYKTREQPYEGHYLHRNVEVEKDTQTLQFYKGDYLVKMNQAKNRFLVETLEPQAPDSYFCWGFFDAILQQKEYFSPYVFEDLAVELLKKDADLKKRLEKKQQEDKEFAKSGYQQLLFIYKNSAYYERSHGRYPIFRSNLDFLDLRDGQDF